MRAAYYERCGGPDVLRVGERPDPTVRGRQVLVAVRAASVNPKDLLQRAGKMPWLPDGGLPRIPGYDFAGEVVALGPKAAGVEVGQAVYGMRSGHKGGSTAELTVVRDDQLAPMPDLGWAEAASVPLAWLTALQALRDCGGMQAGQRVLINGASGGVGTAAVQIAAHLGAVPIAVCSGRNAELVRSLGAAEVVDYTEADPLSAGPVDLVFDVFGNLGFARSRAALGTAFVSTLPKGHVIRAVALHGWRTPSAHLVVVQSRRRDLELLAGWLDAGAMRPVIDRVIPLDDVAEAHRHVGTRRARGKVVVEVVPGAAAAGADSLPA